MNVGYGVAWNGKMWVAVGKGADNSIAYSKDGVVWTRLVGSNSILEIGIGVAWNGRMWVAVGRGNGGIAYSSDGITWILVVSSIFGKMGNGVAGNPNIGATIVDSVITLDSNTNRLDIVADNYNTGYSNFSMDIISNSF